MRVLIVEDHPAFATALRLLLEQHDALVVLGSVSSAEEALADPELEHADVVLIDVGLPGTSGIEATRRLLAQDAGLRIVVMSGSGADETARQAAAAGAAGYIEKGNLDARLAGTLVTAFENSRASQTR